VAFTDEHRDRFGGVEPVRRMLPQHGRTIALSPVTPAGDAGTVSGR
jgi:hypothetical protein